MEAKLWKVGGSVTGKLGGLFVCFLPDGWELSVRTGEFYQWYEIEIRLVCIQVHLFVTKRGE